MANEYTKMAATAKEDALVNVHRFLMYFCTVLLSITAFFSVRTFGQLDNMQSSIQSLEIANQLYKQKFEMMDLNVKAINQNLNEQSARGTVLDARLDALQEFLLDQKPKRK